MVVSFFVAFYFEIIYPKYHSETLPDYQKLITGVAITTAAWLLVTFLTRPADDAVLRKFYRLVRPGGLGWNAVLKKAQTAGEPIAQTATAGDLPPRHTLHAPGLHRGLQCRFRHRILHVRPNHSRDYLCRPHRDLHHNPDQNLGQTRNEFDSLPGRLTNR